MKDFTIEAFEKLLIELKNQGYSFPSLESFLIHKPQKCVIIRHDIDANKNRALNFAKLEHRLGITSSYYFRIVPCSYDERIIKEVAALNHEIGYHYEDLSMNKGNMEKAFESFKKNLETFRKLYPIKTICMHGRAISKYDNRAIWQKYDYKALGIIGEPYFDLDYNKVLYLTDTGQSWDGSRFSIRDKVQSNYQFHFKSTFDIIRSIDKLPNQILITSHPDRWAFNTLEWYYINTHMASRDKLKRMLFLKRGKNIFK
jgi:hypothetical protein